VAYRYRQGLGNTTWSVCRSICHFRKPCKTAEPIEMPFGVWSGLGWARKMGNFEEEGATRCKVSKLSAVNCAKTAEPIEMPFGVSTRVGRRKQVVDGVCIGATWRIRLNHPCAAAMGPYLWSPYVIGRPYIFSSCFFFFLLLFFPRLISAVGDWMFTILWHMVWP